MSKAATRGEKLRRKRGPKPLPANEFTREPNGKPSRRKARTYALEQIEMSTVIDRRIRTMGLIDLPGETAVQQATDTRHGYVLGRLALDGRITRQQHDAGERYSQDMARYFGLTGVQFPSVRAQDLFAVRSTGGEDDQSKADRARSARNRMNELRAVLMGCGDINTGRRVVHTVNAVCVEDIDGLRTLNAMMEAWLKRGLNALVKHYGL